LWSFIKGSGKKLFGCGDEPAPDGGTLPDEIKELGLDATGMEITFEGDTVKFSGEAVSEEMKEKVISAVGNVRGLPLLKTVSQVLANLCGTRLKRAILCGRSLPRFWATARATKKSLKRTSQC
jgi:hypothetical protein